MKGADIVLLYVKEEFPAYELRLAAVDGVSDEWDKALNDRAHKVLNEVKETLTAKGAEVKIEIVSGPPAYLIETVARDESLPLTVILAGHNDLEHFLLGGVAEGVVKHCPGTVLVLRPPAHPEAPLQRVLVAVDGSSHSREAIKTAAQQFAFAAIKPKVTVVHVVSVAPVVTFVSPVAYVGVLEQNLKMEGQTYLAEAQKILADAGVHDVELVLKEGNPAAEICKVAKEINAQLLVIGAQGRSAVQHFLMGSVSTKIATHAPCSTVVVKVDKGNK